MCYQRGLNFTTGYFKTILIVVYLLWTPCRTKNQNLPDGPSPAEVPKGLQRVKWVVGGMSFFRRAAAPVLMYFMDAMMQLPPTSFIPTFLHCLALLVSWLRPWHNRRNKLRTLGRDPQCVKKIKD